MEWLFLVSRVESNQFIFKVIFVMSRIKSNCVDLFESWAEAERFIQILLNRKLHLLFICNVRLNQFSKKWVAYISGECVFWTDWPRNGVRNVVPEVNRIIMCIVISQSAFRTDRPPERSSSLRFEGRYVHNTYLLCSWNWRNFHHVRPVRSMDVLTLFLSGGGPNRPPWGFSCAVPSLVEITTWNFATFP